jgi:twitching motility protein PilU
MIDLPAYLQQMVDRHASDLILSTGAPASVKIDAQVLALDAPPLAAGEVRALAEAMMTPAQREKFATRLECNFSWTHERLGRYRVNTYQQRGETAMVLRRIEARVPEFADLGLPSVVADLAMLQQGLVLVAGAEGSGRSSTLAAMVRYRSLHAPGHILTVEDPIEFLFPYARSIVDQREVGVDTLNFGEALRNAMHEASDVIMVGEVRDHETAQQVLSSAQTGHLCLSALHAGSASQAIERIANLYPEEAHARVLQDLSLNLRAVISQRLVPATPKGQAVAVEVLVLTPLIAELIRHGRLDEIHAAMIKGIEQGMVTFDQSLFELFKAGRISAEQAVAQADSKANLTLKIRLTNRQSAADAPPDLKLQARPGTAL